MRFPKATYVNLLHCGVILRLNEVYGRPATTIAQIQGAQRTAQHVRTAVVEQRQQDSPRQVLHQSVRDGGSVEWYTPAPYVEATRRVMGSIDLDPSSCDVANRVVQATRFYTKDDDGLHQAWAGRIWFNWPYGGSLHEWVAKLDKEIIAGRVTEALGICYAVADRKWYQHLERLAQAVCLTDHRVRFYNEYGVQSSPVAANAVFYYGPKVDMFATIFGMFGRVMLLNTAQTHNTIPCMMSNTMRGKKHIEEERISKKQDAR